MMLLTRCYKRRLVVGIGAALGFFLLSEGTILDSRYTPPRLGAPRVSRAEAGPSMRFSATAYCKGTTTASGAAVRRGIAAADPAVLPVGSVVRIDSGNPRYNGVYTVMDTGPKVQGRHVDLYMWSCHEALRFGRRPVNVSVIRLGWSPGTSGAERAAAAFQERERQSLSSMIP